jgi:signal transduction histidine kinase
MANLQKATKNIKKTLAPAYHSLYFPPAVIFVAIVVATVFGWQAARSGLNQDITAAADSRADVAEQTLREHMVAYEQILRSGAGLFRGSDEVTRQEWNSFLDALSSNRGFPGVQDVGFVKIFDSIELPIITGFMARQGINNFAVTPKQPARDRYAAVLYSYSITPAENPPYGFDMYTEPIRRATMMQARDTGSITMTPNIQLVPEDSGNPRYGFLMFAPYYSRGMPYDTKRERQAALEGYIYASFQSDAFFDGIVGSFDNEKEGFYISASTDGSTRTMYQSPSYADIAKQEQPQHSMHEIKLYGQNWTLNYTAKTDVLVSDEQASRPLVILVFGVLSAALVAAIVLLLMKARARDISTQKEQAVELAKDELLSLASHQLRTPATGVKQYVGMLLQGFAGRLSASQRELLEKAYASNDRQLRIINEILHLAKIGSGRIVPSKQKTNLNELVTDIVNEQMPDIKSSHHDKKLKLPKKPVVVNVDPHILRMAIENLVSNAIKYTPAGGKIYVAVRRSGQQALVAVTDTGVGIKQKDIDKIFRQFSRLPNQMSQHVGGTGIGLYLAKHLVELHGGSIRVKSKPGEGSTFTISLPMPDDS